ncbi:9973_t:CDS:1, partial [Gigaspora margarita]
MEINILFVFIALFMLTSFSITSNEHRKQIPIIIDTDGEVPDFLAILYALKSKEFDVRGVTFNGDGWTHA